MFNQSYEKVLCALEDARRGLEALLGNEHTCKNIVRAAELMVDAFSRHKKVVSCGNGGSFCDAMHFAEELAGRFRRDRRPFPALAISDGAYLSCVANDYGYSDVFSRFVQAHMQEGDVLLAISTSGTSVNVLKAAETARALGARVVALTGRESSPLGALADVEICTPAGTFADRVQELHIKVIHILIELIETKFEAAQKEV